MSKFRTKSERQKKSHIGSCADWRYFFFEFYPSQKPIDEEHYSNKSWLAYQQHAFDFVKNGASVKTFVEGWKWFLASEGCLILHEILWRLNLILDFAGRCVMRLRTNIIYAWQLPREISGVEFTPSRMSMRLHDELNSFPVGSWFPGSSLVDKCFCVNMKHSLSCCF